MSVILHVDPGFMKLGTVRVIVYGVPLTVPSWTSTEAELIVHVLMVNPLAYTRL